MIDNLQKFKKLLHIKRIPHFACPRCKPEDVPGYYQIVPITTKRKVKIGSVQREKVVRVTPKIQTRIYNSLIGSRLPFKPYIIGVSSEPHDLFAMEIAGTITYALLSKNPTMKWEWVPSYRINLNEEVNGSDLVVIYGITPDQTPQRTQYIRDALLKYCRSMRILVISGMSAIEYFDENLKCGLSGMIHVVGKERDFYVESSYVKGESTKDKALSVKTVFAPDFKELLRGLKKSIRSGHDKEMDRASNTEDAMQRE